MKIWEVLKQQNNENKLYKVVIIKNEGERFEEIYKFEFGDLCEIITGNPLTKLYTLIDVNDMEFKEVIDWSKVKKDTKVLVSLGGEQWNKRYFAYYKENKFWCYDSGTTSWSNNTTESWKYCKLAEEENEYE